MEKLRIISAVIVVTIYLIILSISIIYATSTSETLKISTGNIKLGPASIRFDYTVHANLEYPSTVTRGSTTYWKISLSNSKIKIYVNIAGQSFSQDANLPLGEKVEIPITTGLKAYLYASVSSPVVISGKGESDVSKLEFLREGTKTIRIYIPKNVGNNERIRISFPMKLHINGGLKIDLLLIKQDITERSLGTFNLEPILNGELRVVERPSFFDFNLISANEFSYVLIIGIVIGSMIIITFLLIRKSIKKSTYSPTIKEIRSPHKKRSLPKHEKSLYLKESWKPPKVERPPPEVPRAPPAAPPESAEPTVIAKRCPSCGTLNPQGALFCKSCGRRL